MTKSPGNDYSDDLSVPATDAAEAAENAEFSTGTTGTDLAETTASGTSPDTVDSGAAGEPAGPTDSAQPADEKPTVAGSIAGSTWVGLSIGAVILILLLVFILQNQDSVRLQMFVWQWNFPIGVGMLIAAIAGALVMACVGAVRILQLRRQINHPDGARGKGAKAKNR
ncbi:MAG: lipopolysaccharide assembly LapA domain-containing protein [Corynebacterium sp.]|jgi:uncharacterized integral membrane protein|uniref:LapA family protein n=1 Tax=unclassified Corynebacterium TaxID=2624378 RepID=UPI0009675AD3|nr:hypothetical protein BJF89_00495 [Corynebacterium sp. CNJ-954]